MPYGGLSVKELAATLGIHSGSTSRRWRAFLDTIAIAYVADSKKTINAILDADQRARAGFLDGIHVTNREPQWADQELMVLFGLSAGNFRQKWDAALRRMVQVGRLDFARMLSAMVERAREIEREQATT